MNNKKYKPSSIEKGVAYIAAFVVFGTSMFLIIRNEPFADQNLVVIARTMLSFSVATLGATVPGFLRISWQGKGAIIRAGGALALFVLTFLYTPKVLPVGVVDEANIEQGQYDLEKVSYIDFRTSESPIYSDEERLKSPLYITVPIAIYNPSKAKNVFVKETEISFEDNIQKHQFIWLYFVSMNEEQQDVWLGIEKSAGPYSIEAGMVDSRQILHQYLSLESDSQFSWQDFLNLLTTSTEKIFKVHVHVSTNVMEFDDVCNIDTNLWTSKIESYVKETLQIPGRVTASCV